MSRINNRWIGALLALFTHLAVVLAASVLHQVVGALLTYACLRTPEAGGAVAAADDGVVALRDRSAHGAQRPGQRSIDCARALLCWPRGGGVPCVSACQPIMGLHGAQKTESTEFELDHSVVGFERSRASEQG